MKFTSYREESFFKGIEFAKEGARLGDISSAIQTFVEENGYSVVRELVGHGIGSSLHEQPDVPNYGTANKGLRLQAGMTLAIEPMITLGSRKLKWHNDGWGVSTIDGKCAAHFEHTVAVGMSKADILSSFEFVEEVLRNKEN